MLRYADVANSAILWIITVVAIGLVLFQAYYILRRSLKAGKEIGIANDTMKSAFRTGLISSFGPNVVIMLGMVSLSPGG